MDQKDRAEVLSFLFYSYNYRPSCHFKIRNELLPLYRFCTMQSHRILTLKIIPYKWKKK